MREVTQTILHDDLEGRLGNCLQACAASFFDLELHQVPHFILAENWMEVFYAFIEKRGYSVKRVAGLPLAGSGIGSGPSPRGPDWSHAVVVADGKTVWDPHPSREGVPFFDYTWLLEKK